MSQKKKNIQDGYEIILIGKTFYKFPVTNKLSKKKGTK
jgi:hypothetical protein